MTAAVYDIQRGDNGEVIVVIHGVVPVLDFLCTRLSSLTEFTEGTATSKRGRVNTNLVSETITIVGLKASWEEIDQIVDRWVDLVKSGFGAQQRDNRHPEVRLPLHALVVFANKSDD